MIDITPERFRALGYRAVDLMVEHMATRTRDRAYGPVPEDVRRHLMQDPLPATGCEPEEVLERFAASILPYPMGNASPRFFAWVNSPPAPLGVLADLLAAAMNPSVAGGDHAATYVEHATLGWLKAMLGYPATSGGLLTSGGSVANLIGLTVMRSAKAQGDMRAQGVRGEPSPMIVYTSTEAHSCIEKAIELLGFGHANLRKCPVDDDYRLDVSRLAARIAADREAGFRPVCVVATAGTTNTGAIDPLHDIGELCAREGLWLHVDGAYGAFGILADQARGLYAGLEQADSIAADPHKWLYVPVECGCALVRDAEALRSTFSLVPPYLRNEKALPWFSEFGIQQTRGFRALKLWMTLQQVGEAGYRQLITRDVTLARALQARLRARPDFEVLASGPLSITCFRYAPAGVQDLDGLNRRLLDIVRDEGLVFLTSTELHGRLALRACIINFRTTEADLDQLLDAVAEAGQRVLRGIMRA